MKILHIHSSKGRDFLQERVDHPASNVWFYGKAARFNALTSDPLWEIIRVMIDTSGQTVTTYASGGGFTHIWDNRSTYFPTPDLPTPPIPTPFPDDINIYPGIPTFLDFSQPILPETTTPIITYPIPANKFIRLHRLNSHCPLTCHYAVKIDGQVIATQSTSPARPNISFQWIPPRIIHQSSVMVIEANIKSNSVSPDVSAHVMFTESNY